MGTTTAASVRPLPVEDLDRNLIWIVMALCAIGIVAVYSAISYFAEVENAGNTEGYLVRHAARVAVSLGAMWLFSIIPYRIVARLSKLALLLSLGLLVAVKVVGVRSGGAARWLDMGPVGFQPSDMARVALLVYLAVLLTRKQAYIKEWRRAFVPLFVWILATVALIGIEDLSTAALLLAAAVATCFVGRVSLVHLTGMALVGLLLAAGLLLVSPNRAERVEAYLGVKLFPHTTELVLDDQGEGYQKRQARIAIAMGGLVGVGPGKSTQRDFLPAPYNDFIYAIVAEEYGLIGALALLGLFAALLFYGLLRVGRRAPDPLGLFMAVGLTISLAMYGFVHAAVSVGLLPVTGLPLPFVSYGGSSMLAGGVMVGILLNIGRTAALAPTR